MLNRTLLAPVDGNTAETRLMEATLVAPAMRALHKAAKTAGFILSTTGRYRSLQQQWDYFAGRFGRYEPCTLTEYNQRRLEDKQAGRKNTCKVWPTDRRNNVKALLGPQPFPITDSTYWRLINPRSLNAATPGTSNHGLGCSDDLAQTAVVNGKPKTISLTTPCRTWLYSNILEFGFAWESVNDPPHVTWFMGDLTPPALKEREMQLIAAVGDTNVFTLAADRVAWAQGDTYICLVGSGLCGPQVALYRPAFRQFHANGPLPQGWSAQDFASWQP